MSAHLPAVLPSVLPIVLGYSCFASTTGLCLDTLVPQAAALGCSVLAIDNGSPDDSAAQLERYQNELPSLLRDHLQVRLHTRNLGYGGGMNEAVKFGLDSHHFSRDAKPPEWLLLINSDTLFPANSLRAWLTALATAPQDIGILAPLTNNAGNAQKITLDLPASQSAHLAHEFQTWSEVAKQWINAPTGRIWPIARADFFCIAIRTSVWQQLDGLDPIYGRGYYEDFDFSLRAAAVGYQCALTDDCLIYHQGSASFKASSEQKQLIRRNHQLFKNRFPNALTPHVRQSNLTLLQDQLTWLAAESLVAKYSSALLMRVRARWKGSQLDLPRSWLKRWFWQRGLAKLQKIYPQYLSN